jgi:HK97 family phage prohead protease
MEHLLLKAVATTTTDLGQFEAVISSETIDPENDIVQPAAMVSALQAWTLTGKVVPLHWNHSSDPEDIVGGVDPASVKTQGGEVLAAGKVDLDTERGREVWRLMKGGVVGFSFGYLIPEGGAVKRAGGGRRIVQLDVFEITVTPAPMNAGTRGLSNKSAEGDEPPYHRELEAELVRRGIIAEPARAEQYERAESTLTGMSENGDHRDEKAYLDRVHAQSRDLMLALFDAADKQAPKPERKAAAPIQIASFEA